MSARVDFYISGDGSGGNHEVLACRLAEKACKMGHRVYIHTASAEQAGNLDTLLWTFSGGSFVPHHLLTESRAPDPETPVLISHLPPPASEDDVLINLLPEVPPHYRQFKRVTEPVGADEKDKAQARQRYKQYKEQGAEVVTHEV